MLCVKCKHWPEEAEGAECFHKFPLCLTWCICCEHTVTESPGQSERGIVLGSELGEPTG